MWRIRYADGVTLSSGDLRPEDLPFARRFGVLWIYQGPDEDRLFNKDFYLWDGEAWTEHDLPGLLYELATRLPVLTCYVQGATVRRHDWREAMREMTEAADGDR